MSRRTNVVLLLATVTILVSCDRIVPDLSRLQEGNFYVAQDVDRGVVLYVEEVTKQSFKGRWYVENGSVANPHHFMAESTFWYKRKMKSDSLVVRANAMHGDTLIFDLLLDKSWETLRFLPWRQPPVMNLQRSYLYHDRLFDVAVDTNVVYAHAKGYWPSYPEPEIDCDKYLPILMEKWLDKEEMTLKDLELTMDIYTPKTNNAMRRPLLLLIHGGAFFNGDKCSAGYTEWGRYFASLGYVVASINYRLGFQPYGPKHVDRAGYRAVQDARAAICYLLRHPERYPIDPNYIFVGGSSAGGITALNLAFMTNLDRPTSTKAGPVNEVYNDVLRLFSNSRKHKRKEKHKDVGLEDLGGIDTVAAVNGGAVDFNINTVVNMWGAVHKIEMIDMNSPGTAVLSFHGDADSVVAYGYDYPFARKEPFNKLFCNEMYGSKCIHEHALKDRRSELHTVKGGGHSLHADCSELTDYYTLITDTITRFLYLRMFPRPSLHKKRDGKQQWFELENAGEVQTCRWEAIGGSVLEAEPDRARVLFFGDEEEKEHKLRIVGQQKNGRGYDEMYNVD